MQTTEHALQPLLVELFTEELPPKALQKLGLAFAEGIQKVLDQHGLLADTCQVTDFATPRRLAVLLDAVRAQAPDREFTEKLMPAKIGLDEQGNMTPALTKRLQSKGLGHITANQLIVESDGKQDFVFARGVATGTTLQDGLQEALDTSLANLPIPKVMRYQLPSGESVRFVRPAHGLIALWGDQVVPVTALGLKAGRDTDGHRFMGPGAITIPHAEQYESLLGNPGHVVASFTQRRALIAQQLKAKADDLGSTIGDSPETTALLDEVTALVEHPTVYAGEFDEVFLRVPPECLTLTMRLNQKYFPLFNPTTGTLTNRFLIVSNMQVSNPANIIEGNERVVRPRLADAQFFFDTDLKTPLADRVDPLKNSVYHNKLGSQLQRVERVQAVAGFLAEQLGADVALSRRSAWLAKADLVTGMVAEFPELQGIMGAYYAENDGEDPAVVQAIRNQYRLRLDTAVTPETLVSAVLFISERVETLVGIWGIGLPPTGERDPFGLRRAALGIISAYEQLEAGGYLDTADSTRLRLTDILQFAAARFDSGTLSPDTVAQVRDYIYERYRNQLTQQYDRAVVDAVLAVYPPLHQVQARIRACMAFAAKPEAPSLAAANKRVGNILRKASDTGHSVDDALLREPAEQELARQIRALTPEAQQQYKQGDFAASLATLAKCGSAVDNFFDNVMIMADDDAIRANRLALLRELHGLMNQVADISRLDS